MNHDPKITKKTDIRRELIIEMTQQEGNVSVETLVEVLGVSAQTIRRDINHLCNDNRLRRRHGGVERFEQPLNTPYDQRAITNHSEKRAIAMAAADMIPNGSTLFISIGSTPAMVAEALHDKTGLTVMTNNLNAAMALSSELTNRVILPVGNYASPTETFWVTTSLRSSIPIERSLAFLGSLAYRKMGECWISTHPKCV